MNRLDRQGTSGCGPESTARSGSQRLRFQVDGLAAAVYHSLAMRSLSFVPLLFACLFAPARSAATPPRTWREVSQWYEESSSYFHGWEDRIQQSELRFHSGDDPAWASASFDDAGWRVVDRDKAIPRNQGIFWIRFRTRAKTVGDSLPTGFMTVEPAANEVYWDGTLVHRNGIPGRRRAEEVPGPVYSLFDLPNVATGPGEHVVALRMSTYWFNRPDSTLNLIAGNVPMSATEQRTIRAMLIPMLGVGALAFFGIAALILWIATGRPRGVLIFAGLNFGGAITLFSIHVRHLFPLPYSWSFPVWTATELLAAITAALLVALVLVQFELPRRCWLAGAFVAFEVVAGIREALIHHLSEPFRIMLESWHAAFAVCVGLLLWAVCRRRWQAGYVLGVVILAALWYEHDPERFLTETFPLTMMPVLLSFVLVIGQNLSAERRQAREARLTAARLELELLRKSLQPHFLMNTLTAVSQAMEENPVSAARLIEDLAAELRELAQFAEYKEVPLDRELDLCRAHLRVMSARTEKPWKLEVVGHHPAATVPPALFFTLIENGFTHQQPIPGATTFRLKSEAIPGGLRYEFFAPGGVRLAADRPAGGSGLRYVKARLNECWPGGWTFEHGPSAGGWSTRVELRQNSRRKPR